MAYLEGHPGNNIDQKTKKHLGFMLIVTICITVSMLAYSNNWKDDLSSIALATFVIVFIMGFVSLRLNRLGWKKIFNRSDFEQIMKIENRVIDKLGELDDHYFVLNDFTFELFHVEHLVISGNGIFVIGKNKYNNAPEERDGILFAGDNTLETLTSNLWRLCHLINIIIKKGFNKDIMPRPVLVSPELDEVSTKDFNGIALTGMNSLNRIVTSGKSDEIDSETAEGFALFLKQRYIH